MARSSKRLGSTPSSSSEDASAREEMEEALRIGAVRIAFDTFDLDQPNLFRPYEKYEKLADQARRLHPEGPVLALVRVARALKEHRDWLTLRNALHEVEAMEHRGVRDEALQEAGYESLVNDLHREDNEEQAAIEASVTSLVDAVHRGTEREQAMSQELSAKAVEAVERDKEKAKREGVLHALESMGILVVERDKEKAKREGPREAIENAIHPGAVKATFHACDWSGPALASTESDRYVALALLAEREGDERSAAILYRISSALNEHRHFLSHSRGGDDEGAKRRAEARDRYLRDAGIEL